MFQSLLRASLFVMCKYRDVLGADQTESGIWIREIDHIYYLKRKLVTLRLRCVSVSNSLNISRTQKMSWQRCDNFLTTFRCSSGGTTCPMLQRQQWLVNLFDDEHYDDMLWQILTWTVQPVLNSGYNVSQYYWEAVSNSHRICSQIWLYINYEAESGYHFYLRSGMSFLTFPVSCPWMRVEMDGETNL